MLSAMISVVYLSTPFLSCHLRVFSRPPAQTGRPFLRYSPAISARTVVEHDAVPLRLFHLLARVLVLFVDVLIELRCVLR